MPKYQTAKPAAPASDGKVHVFISYAHPDAEIAQALYEALKETNSGRVVCFLDTFTISTGDDWAQKIQSELRASDWLIFIYHEGQSYEFCGFEIGVFEALHGLTERDRVKSSRRLFTIHDVEPLPSLLRFRQNRKVETWPGDDDLKTGRELTPAEVDFYAATPLGQFFAEFAAAPSGNPLVPMDDPLRDAVRLRAKVARQARDVTVPFRKSRLNDLRSELIYQNRVEIEIGNARFWEQDDLLRDAVISGKESTFLLLGYAGPAKDGTVRVSWGALQEHYRQSPAVMPWLDAVGAEIAEAGRRRLPRDEIICFKSAHDGQVYRPVVARQEIFHSGARRFYVLFIKARERHFSGEPHSSMLLAGIVMGSRTYFHLFEEGNLAARLFGPELNDDEFDAACQQLIYDIVRMELESSELGITNPDFLIEALGQHNRGIVETQFHVWKEAKLELFSILNQRLRLGAKFPRSEVSAAVTTFTTRLEAHNKRFLLSCMDAYHKLMSSKLGRRNPAVGLAVAEAGS